jgi:hypothetical protein
MISPEIPGAPANLDRLDIVVDPSIGSLAVLAGDAKPVDELHRSSIAGCFGRVRESELGLPP